MDKKIALVTGGAGFIGSHLCEKLYKEGYRVISLDNYFTGSKDNHVEGVEYIEGHTKDIEEHIRFKPDIIYHLGEYSRVEQSVLEPDVVHDLNIIGTEGVIEFWKKIKCKLIYAGSSTKFGDASSPYSISKAENSEKVRGTGEKEKLNYAITYFYNVYGPRERSGIYGTVIEHFKRMYISGMPCAVVAPGTQERNFTHVADIVAGLVRTGEDGKGDEYGLGCKISHTINGVADLFGFGKQDIVIFPERPGNRMKASLDTGKAESLGWRAKRELKDYINSFVTKNNRGASREKRILVFSTTIYPDMGLSEESFMEVAKLLPEVTFDVVTTKFSKASSSTPSPLSNVHFHRIGVGTTFDKYLLPLFGFYKGITLSKKHSYLFTWSLMASYAAVSATALKRLKRMPLLVTLADQNLDDLSFIQQFILQSLISSSDQVYGTHSMQEKRMQEVAKATLPRNSMGEGDAFANALRFAYANIVRTNDNYS